ncbi:MAG: hypothetical protein AUH85_14600 [Chloroflexi bacterium 13_1_40CM_4_68_4]|nr:MAG: hypothetical protein AUH85_14600 [Chloroflexi bacterium 13_1_40CM_4_68_4]
MRAIGFAHALEYRVATTTMRTAAKRAASASSNAAARRPVVTTRTLAARMATPSQRSRIAPKATPAAPRSSTRKSVGAVTAPSAVLPPTRSATERTYRKWRRSKPSVSGTSRLTIRRSGEFRPERSGYTRGHGERSDRPHS